MDSARFSNRRLRRSLEASTLDGCFHAAMVGMGELYVPALALLLGATTFEVGLLTTLPMLVGTAFQLVAPAAAHRVGGKRWVVASAALQGLSFAPMVALAAGSAQGYLVLLAAACAYWSLALGINPVWSAWMGQMIPSAVRGRYFARRNSAIQATLFSSLLIGGLVIDATTRTAAGAALGFVAVFSLASVFRLASAWQLARQHEPAGALPAGPRVRLSWEDLRTPSLRRLIFLIGGLNGAVYVSASFFTPYMLETLDLSYLEFTGLNATIVVARVLSSPYWGTIGQRFGHRRALQVASTLLVPLSALWVVSDNYAYLVVLQVVAGFAWAGFDLMTVLTLFDCTDDRNRARVLSVFNLVNGLAIVLGTFVGGLVLRELPAEGFAVVFLGSMVLRIAALLAFGSGVGVAREQEHSFGDVFVRVTTLRPGMGPRIRPIVMASRRRRRLARVVRPGLPRGGRAHSEQEG